MRELISDGNLFSLPSSITEAAVVTTNGVCKRDGKAVMGAGIAKYARDHFHGIDELLGHYLRIYKNHVFYMGTYCIAGAYVPKRCDFSLFTFPTKEDWKYDSRLDLIAQSAHELAWLCTRHDIQTCYLPCPGCTNGKLDYQTQVKPVLEAILDDRFVVVVPSSKL